MDLFVRESGPVGAPTIVFLHGAKMSGWSWQPVVQRMQRYHCLAPDLPYYGKSFQEEPFEMGRAADAVAELIRSRVARGRAHVVGFSLGAQVGVQLLATEPKLVDRAVMCGTVINTMPYVGLTQRPLGLLARMRWFRRAINRLGNARRMQMSAASIDDYREDVRLITGEKLVHIIAASSGFTLPPGIDKSDSPTLFLTGAKEMWFVHRWAATLAQHMPNGVDRVAIGMRHDWPLRYTDLFSRTVDGWLNGTALPPEIALPSAGR
jgi:pimeloyl-ACP methyl ester carboxylesterase